MVKMGNFGFIQGYDYIVKVFALYHGMSEEEVRDYFDKSGIIPYLSINYCGLCYTPSLDMVQKIRRKLEEGQQSVPKQVYSGYMYADGVTPTPPY